MMNLFEKIRLEGMQRRDFFKDFGCVYLLQMLYSLLRYEKEENLSLKQKDDLITEESAEAADRVAEYIRKHYMQDISLKVISESIGYNKSYICQIFCRKYGRPLMKYLYSYRVGKARELMLYSDYSLKQISEMTGFSSIHHFSRMFHKLEGITAGQWRKKERDGIRKDVYISDDFTNTVNTFERLT
jgi:YesN/AraC family two-component response regulator